MILVILLIIPVAYILLFVIKEIVGYVNLSFYTRQGIKTIYKPVVGFASLLMGTPKNNFTGKYLNFQL